MVEDYKQNVVFILGAGCSQEDGAPLINNFFKVAFSNKIKKELTDEEKESFKDLREFRERHLPNSNIEEFFSFIDLQSTINTIHLDMSEINNKRNLLIHLISRTIQISLIGSGETLNKRFIIA